jgi:hypothetical protein
VPPASVLVPIVLLGALLVANVEEGAAAGQLPVAPVILQSLVIAGLATRQRLAWQWARVLPILAGFLLLALSLMASSRAPDGDLWPLGVALAALAIAVVPAVALGRPSARDWFRLVCPSCGGRSVKAANFVFTKVRCRGCEAVF